MRPIAANYAVENVAKIRRPRHLPCPSRVLEAQHQDIAKTKQKRQGGGKSRPSIAEVSKQRCGVDVEKSRQKAVGGGCAGGAGLNTLSPYLRWCELELGVL
jgi:hypothetical protein